MSVRDHKPVRVAPTQWGDLEAKLGLLTPQFSHVHICNAAAEERPCTFDWDKHDLSNVIGQCDCFPEIDGSSEPARENGLIFIVHRGVC